MSDNVNLSKKIVTYEAMSKYDECLKQFINNKLANFDGGSAGGSANTNNALPIGNLDDGIHTWENLTTAVYEKSFGGPIQIHNLNGQSSDGESRYIIYSGTYLGVCNSNDDHYNTGGTPGPESAAGYSVNTFNLPTTTTTTSSSTTTTTTSSSTTTTTTSSSTTTPELEVTTSTSEIYCGPNLVLMIGNVLMFETYDGSYWSPMHYENGIHTTDYHIVGLSIENYNEAGYNDLNEYRIETLFDIPIASLASLTSKITELQNQLNNVAKIPEYTVNSGVYIDVEPNTSVVVSLDDSEFSNYLEILLVPPTKPGYVYEYRLILKDEYGGYRDIYFDTPWGGTIHWANDDAPDFAHENNPSATYEINIRLYINPDDIEYDDSNENGEILSCFCDLWGTYTKYS